MIATKQLGDRAEQRVAAYLTQRGYSIVDRNWKHRTCEIDIVAKRGEVIHFVEVKYRSVISNGDGFSYISAAKQRRMGYAARLWNAVHSWDGDYVVGAASVTGQLLAVEYIESIS